MQNNHVIVPLDIGNKFFSEAKTPAGRQTGKEICKYSLACCSLMRAHRAPLKISILQENNLKAVELMSPVKKDKKLTSV